MTARVRLSICKAAIAALALGVSQPGRAAEGGPPDGRPARSPTTAAILERAPAFQIILDISGSSPALDQTLIDSVAPAIAAQVKAMPVGTLVTISTVGDATVPSSLLRMQIQARGATAGDVARKLQRFLHDFPREAKDRAQGRSDLVGGFAAAASYVNRKSDANAIVMVSDLVEYSALADCSRARKCALPAKPSFDLGGAHVQVYGVGQGQPSPRAMQLTADWRAFLARANAGRVDLRRF